MKLAFFLSKICAHFIGRVIIFCGKGGVKFSGAARLIFWTKKTGWDFVAEGGGLTNVDAARFFG